MREQPAMLLTRLRDLLRYPTPYESEHRSDPLFAVPAGRVPLLASPAQLKSSNIGCLLWLGGILLVVWPVGLWFGQAPPPTHPGYLRMLVYSTVTVWLLGFVGDVICAVLAANSLRDLKDSDQFDLIRLSAVTPLRLSIASYHVALLRTWIVMWVMLIFRWANLILWALLIALFPFFYINPSIPDLSAYEFLYGLLCVLVVYITLGYVFIREPYWRWRIMVAIGMQQAVRYSSQPAAVFWSVVVVIGFWIIRIFVGISIAAFFMVFIGFSIGSLGFLLLEFMSVNGLFTAVAVSAFLLVTFVSVTFVSATFAWAYRSLVLDRTDPYEIGVTEKLHVKLKSLLEPED
ncbi:MAG: hypothetical protein AAF787_05525 [Chloroflexota bacterium]